MKCIAGAEKVFSKKHNKEMTISPTTVEKVLNGTCGVTVEEGQATSDKAREGKYKAADAPRRINRLKKEEKDDA